MLQGGEIEADELPDSHKDTVYRVSWWVAIASEVMDESQLGSGEPDAPLSHLLETLGRHCQRLEENGEAFDELDALAEQIATENGASLRRTVRSAIGVEGGSTSQENLDELRAYLPELIDQLELTVESLRTGQAEQPAALLEPLVEGLTQVSRALAGLGANLEKHGIDVDASVFESHLTDLVSAVEQGDSIEVADLLDYEIRPLFSGYHRRLQALDGVQVDDDTLWSSNLASLASKKGGERQVRNIEEGSSSANEYVEVGEARDGRCWLRLSNENGESTLVSQYQPGEAARRWARMRTSRTNSEYFVIFGLAGGYRIRALLDRLSNDAKLLIVEPSYRLAEAAFSSIDFTDILEDSRVELLVGNDMKSFQTHLAEWIDWKDVTGVECVALPNYSRLSPETHERLRELVEMQATTVLFERGGLAERADKWTRNIIQNLQALPNARFSDGLENAFEDKPVVIVSAGPSLDKNIEELKGNEDKVVIIAVDTVVTVLESHGIEPHIVITVDGLEINYEQHLEDTSYSDTPMVATMATYPPALQNHQSEQFILPSEMDAHEILADVFRSVGIDPEQLVTFDRGLAVSHVAYQLAEIMGASPIILIGQDLAYAQTGSDYAAGIKHKNASKQRFFAEGIHGEKVETNEQWYSFLIEFQKMIQPDDFVIDATEGGLKISGTDIRPLDEVIEQHCQESFEPGSKIASIWENSAPPFSTDDYDAAAETIGDMFDKLRDIEKQLSKGQQLCRELKQICDGYEEGQEPLREEDKQRADELLADIEVVDEQLKNSDSMSLLAKPLRAISQESKSSYKRFNTDSEITGGRRKIAEVTEKMYEQIESAIEEVRLYD